MLNKQRHDKYLKCNVCDVSNKHHFKIKLFGITYHCFLCNDKATGIITVNMIIGLECFKIAK